MSGGELRLDLVYSLSFCFSVLGLIGRGFTRGWEGDSDGYFENDNCGYCGRGGSAFKSIEKGG